MKLYDTLTREKRPFRPLDPARVRMYVCGPTVYDFAHIGNARPVIVFDVLFRLLRHLYGTEHVAYVRNITDVDDKINARAAERGIGIRVVLDALSDDLNTHAAITELHGLGRIARSGDFHVDDSYYAACQLAGSLELLGFERLSAGQRPLLWLDETADEAFRKIVASRVEQRDAARRTKNFAESDRIRDELAAMGVVLKDTKDGTTTWEIDRQSQPGERT